MTHEDYKPRFSFEITPEQQLRANRLITAYGLRKAIFGRVLDEVLDLVEEHGGMALGILMSPDTKPREILPSMKEVEKKGGRDG